MIIPFFFFAKLGLSENFKINDFNNFRVPPLIPTVEVKDDRFDAVLVVTDTLEKLTGDLECLKGPLEDYSKVRSSTCHRSS